MEVRITVLPSVLGLATMLDKGGIHVGLRHSLSLSSAWWEFGGLSIWWVTTKQLLLGFAGFDLHDQTQLRSNWKLVAKLATGFMSVRIPMLSVFELHELYQCQKF